MIESSLRLLIVEDSLADAQLILRELRQSGLAPDTVRVDTEEGFITQLSPPPHLILCDFNLPQFDAMRALELLRERNLDIPFLIVSGSIGEETATRAIKQGATDYLLKDRLGRLGPAVRQALEQQKLRAMERDAQLERARDAMLLASVRDSVIVTDMDGIVTYWNEGATRLLGWTADEMLGQPYMDRFPEYARAIIAEQLQERTAGSEWNGEFEDYRKDGTRIWIHARVTCICDSAGQPEGILGLAYDITDRKRTEEELRHIMRSALCLFWSAIVSDVGEEGLQWDVVHYDEESAQRFLPLDVAPGDTYMHTAYLNRHPADVETTNLYGAAQVRAGQSYSQDYRCRAQDGQWNWHHEDVHVETIGPGLWHVVVVTTDITERKQAEETRRELEERFLLMADTAPVLIWMAGMDMQADWFNKPWLDFTGRSLDQEMGEGWLQNLHPEDRQAYWEIYWRAFQHQEPFRIEYRLRRYDGVYRWVLSSGSPRFAGGNSRENSQPTQFVGYIGCCVDVTEKHEAEQERVVAIHQQQAFLRDVLFSVTEGHLYLCASSAELPAPLSHPTSASCIEEVGQRKTPIALNSATLSEVRRQVRTLATQADFPDDRAMGLMSAASECSMNAVTHGGEKAEAHVLLAPDCSMLQVWVRDYGGGIDVSELPKATLMKGYSGSGAVGGFGHGFFLMLQYVDRIYLLTGPDGTTVVIEQSRTPPSEEFLF